MIVDIDRELKFPMEIIQTQLRPNMNIYSEETMHVRIKIKHVRIGKKYGRTPRNESLDNLAGCKRRDWQVQCEMIEIVCSYYVRCYQK